MKPCLNPATGVAAVIAVVVLRAPLVLFGADGDFKADFYARAYVESGYMSSGGVLTYTEPVAEQYALGRFQLGRFGRITTDAWLCSALNDQTDHIHRRAFYILEETLMYGYDFEFSKSVKLTTDAGVLWDWLWGYKEPQDMPVAWYAYQYLRNPYVTPYWNGLGCFYPSESTRIRFGLERGFVLFESLTLTPFVDTTFGDKNKFAKNFGAEAEGSIKDGAFMGGAFMTITFGTVLEWRLSETWSVWGRYRQYMVLNKQARDSLSSSDSPTAETCFPIFGLGLGARF